MTGYISSWAYYAKAHKKYECTRCGLDIEPGMWYQREVISCGGSLIVDRTHDQCPPERDYDEFIRDYLEKMEKEEKGEQAGLENLLQAA